MRKRFWFVIAMCAVLLFPLVAESVTARGEGKGKDEALLAARTNLAESLFSSVSSSGSVTNRDKEESASDSSYFSISMDGDAVILGAKTSYRKTSGGYLCTITIDQDALNLYEVEIDTLFQEISDLNASRLSSHNNSERVSIDLSLLEKIAQYQSSLLVAVRLGSTVSHSSLPVSYSAIQVEFDRLRPYYNDADIASLISDSAKAMARIEQDQRAMEAQEKREAMRREQEEKVLRQRLDKETERLLEQSERQASAYYATLPVLGASSLTDAMQAIQQKRLLYRQEGKKWDDQYEETLKAQEKSAAAASEAVMGRRWTSAELVGNVPSKDALREREIEAAKAYDDVKVKYDSPLQTILEQKEKACQNLALAIDDMLEKISEKRFVINSKDADSLSYRVGSYDGSEQGWPLSVSLMIAGRLVDHEFLLDYQTVTGEYLPDLRDEKEYKAYLSKVDVLNAFLVTTKNPLAIQAEFSISGSLASSEYVIDDLELSVALMSDPKQVIVEEYVGLDREGSTITVGEDIPVKLIHGYMEEGNAGASVEKEKGRQENTEKRKTQRILLSAGYGLGQAGQGVSFSAGYSYSPFSWLALQGKVGGIAPWKGSILVGVQAGAGISFSAFPLACSLSGGLFVACVPSFALGGYAALTLSLMEVYGSPSLSVGGLFMKESQSLVVSIGFSPYAW